MRLFSFPVSGLIVTGLFPATAGQAQTLKEILAGSLARYRHLKTYQVETTILLKNSLFDNKTVGKTKIDGKKVFGDTTTTGKDGVSFRNIVYMDGKKIISYTPAMKIYIRQPLPKGTFSGASNPLNQNSPIRFLQAAPKGTLKRLPDTSLSNESVFVLRSSDNRELHGTMTLFIDKKTFGVRKVSNRVKGEHGGEETLFEQVFTKEMVNAPIPASTFVFTPSPGVKEQSLRSLMPPDGKPFPHR